MLAFCEIMCYYMEVLRGTTKYPGVAKFGIALEWGSRGLEFESRHSDQVRIIRTQSSKLEMCSDFLFLLTVFSESLYLGIDLWVDAFFYFYIHSY